MKAVMHQLASRQDAAREWSETPCQPTLTGIRIELDGLVQGVGFRPWVHALAHAAAIRGRVWNHPTGVTIEAFGAGDALRVFVGKLQHPPMPAARVHSVHCEPIPHEAVESFEIVASHTVASHTVASGDGDAHRPSIPPDLATCDDCRRELLDPTDRRFRYPLINCTRCGPRYTISLDVPYDRPRTTMGTFLMCEACRREYEDPGDRRFHAQPNACPECGPRLRLVDAQGDVLAGDPMLTAAQLLRDGHIVAVKGLGGYHLACDATRADVVAALRARKHREEKPFAVMVSSLDLAEHLAQLSPAERDLLAASSRPIVLVTRCPGSGLAYEVAPGNPLVGLMLPYTPLHELLLAEVGRPLVMTSGNRSDEPMVCNNDEARQRLGGIADFFLQHDREIANRCDDSVARVLAGRPVVLRRSRGWVPGNFRVPRRFPQPILACGAHLKNTFCLADGDAAWLGPHIGDLETHEACAAFEAAVARFQRFVGIEPAVVAHDLHPDYFSTRYALEHHAPVHIAVQHHHAHVASAMAEHGLDGPVIGLAWDGTGYGTDGTAWGGELLVAGFADFRRLATFRPIRLAGGDRAIREVWRIALALLDDAFDGDPPLDSLPMFTRLDPSHIHVARRLLATRFQAPLARGVGRYFDAFGAIVLGKIESRYEGQVAMQLTFAADPSERRAYPFEMEAAATSPLPSAWPESDNLQLRSSIRRQEKAATRGDRIRAHEGKSEDPFTPSRPHLFRGRIEGPLRSASRLPHAGEKGVATVDLRPAVRAAVEDLISGRSAATVAGRFHATMAAAAVEMVRLAEREVGRLPVVLTGGCFQNARLVEDILAALPPRFRVHIHEQVPPNDGGIALGQAMVAGARLRERGAAADMLRSL
jgi:hydrogenase maturation protein HypF